MIFDGAIAWKRLTSTAVYTCLLDLGALRSFHR